MRQCQRALVSVMLCGFAAVGCFKENAEPGPELAGAAAPATGSGGSQASENPARDAGVSSDDQPHRPAAAGRMADQPASSEPCNGAPLRRQGSGYVCDCGEGQTGPFCDGSPGSDDDAGTTQSSGEHVSTISSCGYATCALLESGRVRCWGHNEWGAIGDGTRTHRASAVAVKDLADVKQLEVGLLNACAVITDGTLRCWGDNDSMPLRDGTNNDRTVPVMAQGLTDVVQVSVGERQICVRHADNALECWGSSGRSGELPPANTRGVVDVEAGYFVTTAWMEDGSVRSWGHPTPAIPIGKKLKHITSGYAHICALIEGGTVRCGGQGSEGQLGGGGFDRDVPGIGNAIGIAAGFEHTCAVLSDGSVRCWGQNNLGQLGDGSNDDRFEAVQVPGLDHVVDVTAGRDHTCARRDDDSVWCWGSNKYGQLGNGTMTDSNVPVAVRGL